MGGPGPLIAFTVFYILSKNYYIHAIMRLHSRNFTNTTIVHPPDFWR